MDWELPKRIPQVKKLASSLAHRARFGGFCFSVPPFLAFLRAISIVRVAQVVHKGMIRFIRNIYALRICPNSQHAPK